MNVLLLHAPYTRRSYFAHFTLVEPLTEIFLGPVLAPRHACRLVDLRITPDLGRALGDWCPDAAVVSVMHLSLGALDAVLGQLLRRAPRCRVLLVGAADYGVEHLVERPLDYATPLADAIAPGFFINGLRRVVPQVLDAWEAGREPSDVPGLLLRVDETHFEPTAPAEIDVGPIGVPDRTLLGRSRGRYRAFGMGRMAWVMYTYGCRFSCRYCTLSKAGNQITVRPLGEVLEEIEALTEPNVFLADFEPLQAPEAMLRLAGSLEASGVRKHWALMTRADSVVNHTDVLQRWKEIGLRWVYLGLDGHDDARLRAIGKGSTLAVHEAALATLRRLGLHVFAGLTIPTDFGKEDFAAVRRAVGALRPPVFDFSIETPLVGTRLFDETQGKLTTRDWSLFDLNHAVLPTRLPLHEFYKEMGKLHRFAWGRSGPNILRAHPLRDVLHNALIGPRALWQAAHAARDHARSARVPVPT